MSAVTRIIGDVALICCSWCGANGQMTASKTALHEAQDVIIPDGTRIQLRFATPVWGYVAIPPTYDASLHAKRGDRVRLVVAAEVRISNKVIFARGAIAQATVTNVWIPNPK